MQREGTLYTLGFAALVCVVCSILVCLSAVLLKDRQDLNKLLDRQMKVLSVAGVIESGESLSAEKAQELFDANIQLRFVSLESGEELTSEQFAAETSLDPAAYDQRKAKDDSELGRKAPKNAAQVARLPNYAVVFLVMKDDAIEQLILPVEGKGLWSTLYGFLALDKDTATVRGLTFYEHGETPGLGGEVDNPVWKGKWVGRKAFDESWAPKIAVIKGRAGSPEEDPYQVDGLSGATLTSRGVSNLIQFWLGESGFGPYLAKFRTSGSAA
jgi:Na+-transporting NADH:ubiquinone oxidoreductase subunit C